VCVALTAVVAAQSYVPHRVFDNQRGAFSDFEAMAADLATADVVFVGEQHDDPNTHRLELAVLEALARRSRPVVLSLEMFERDAQEPLEHFLMGHLEEVEFLKVSRPWPRYATDYKPLVDLAIAREWPVVAANVPRPFASEVAKGGLGILDAKSEADRKLFATDLKCPLDDEYFRRFAEAMGGHPAPGTSAEEARRTTERYYFAQCLKDETMAESIARALASSRSAEKRATVVHFNGSFHSDFGLGTAERLRRRAPDARVIVVSIQPSADLDRVTPSADDRNVGQYLVYTVKNRDRDSFPGETSPDLPESLLGHRVGHDRYRGGVVGHLLRRDPRDGVRMGVMDQEIVALDVVRHRGDLTGLGGGADVGASAARGDR
jgi:uncharacterized iron-regulated protein